jgi:hypothetical protein
MDFMSALTTSPHAYPQIVCFAVALGSVGSKGGAVGAAIILKSEKLLVKGTRLLYDAERGLQRVINKYKVQRTGETLSDWYKDATLFIVKRSRDHILCSNLDTLIII